MTTIIVTHENNEMDEYDFDVEIKTITIGRRSTNDVCVPHLSVSGVHCKITIDGEGSMIEDQNSTNGTYINGRLISRQLLNDGDDIVIGKARLTFLQPDNLPASPNTGIAAANPDHDAQSSNLDPVTDDKEPLSLAEKAALNLRPAGAAGVAVAGAGAAVAGSASGAFDDVAGEHSPAAVEDNGASEFAGDYYEPDDSEIKAMISDAPAEDLDSDAFGQNDIAENDMARNDMARNDMAQNNVADMATPEPGTAGLQAYETQNKAAPEAIASDENELSHILDHTESPETAGAVIEIKNGAKSGQVLPIDKPVTTLGRPGIQIAAIMKKPEGYFLMHIESENTDDRPRLNDSMIGDDPVMLNSGDSLKVAGIDVEFMLS